MQNEVTPIWHHLPADLVDLTEQSVHRALERQEAKNFRYIFFRADDVAAPGRKLARLIDIFMHHRVPLCLAVVPAWLSTRRWQYLKGLGAKKSSLWCWHQHGWRHINHEIEDKKQEFGASRSRADIQRDLVQGRQRLEDLMATDFYPVFTPPWNRCSFDTLQLLWELGYTAVSRSSSSRPTAPKALGDYCVNVDLHTRKERNPALGWRNLFNELQQALSSDSCGIMIHHQRMNDGAFDFLEMLLKTLVRYKEFQLIHFKDLS